MIKDNNKYIISFTTLLLIICITLLPTGSTSNKCRISRNKYSAISNTHNADSTNNIKSLSNNINNVLKKDNNNTKSVNLNYILNNIEIYNYHEISNESNTSVISNVTNNIQVVSTIKYESSITVFTNHTIVTGKRIFITANLINTKGQPIENASVTFKLNDKTIGKSVTGKHGIAYVYYTPQKEGIFLLKAIFSGNKIATKSDDSIQINIINND